MQLISNFFGIIHLITKCEEELGETYVFRCYAKVFQFAIKRKSHVESEPTNLGFICMNFVL